MSARRRRGVPRHRATLVAFLVLIGILLSISLATARVNLGLDLQGGIGVVLTAPAGTGADVVDKAIEIIRARVDALGVAEPEIARQGTRNIQISLPGIRDRDEAIRVVGTTAQLQFRPVLEVLGPAGIALPPAPETDTIVPTDTVPVTDTAGSQEEEADETGSQEEEADETGSGDDEDAAADTSPADGEAATADTDPTEFRAATAEAQLDEEEITDTPPADPEGEPVETLPPELQDLIPGAASAECADAPVDPATGVTPREQDITSSVVILVDDRDLRYCLGPAEVVGSDVVSARAVQQQTQTQSGAILFGEWQVELQFTGEGDEKYRQLTADLACFPPEDDRRRIAIVLDSEIQSAPVVAQQVACGQGISGGGVITIGSDDEPRRSAETLATVLRFGALPAPFERSSIQEISATLGRDSLRTGLIAGIVGLLLVVTYMVLYYRALGVVVVLGLAVFTALLYSVVSLLSEHQGLSLTLAGVAGMIVSLGITTDSYIVYFERIKDEVRNGRTVRSAVDRGFRRAFKTILTADAVTFGAAAVLYLVAVSGVRGFALLLGIATLIDVTVAWFFTRNIVALLAPTRWFGEARAIGLYTTKPVAGTEEAPA